MVGEGGHRLPHLPTTPQCRLVVQMANESERALFLAVAVAWVFQALPTPFSKNLTHAIEGRPYLGDKNTTKGSLRMHIVSDKPFSKLNYA